MNNRENEPLRVFSRWTLAIAFILAGANHFRSPEIYLAMMPPWLPDPRLLNVVSGATEIAGGIGVLFPFTRRIAAIGLILLLIAIFPANIHVAINGWPGSDLPRWMLLARLPLQFLFIAWVLHACPRALPISLFKTNAVRR